MGKRIFASIIVMFFCAGLAIASDQTRKKDQKRDGSCEIIQQEAMQNQIMEKAQIQKRDRIKTPDRKRDGSCEIIGADSAPVQMTAKQNAHRNGNQKGDLKRIQSRSCEG